MFSVGELNLKPQRILAAWEGYIRKVDRPTQSLKEAPGDQLGTQAEAPQRGVYTEEIMTIEVCEEFGPALKVPEEFDCIVVLYRADRQPKMC